MNCQSMYGRAAITGFIAVPGAVGGALSALGLTFLANVLIDAVRATGGSVQYQWSVGAFALIGALACPLLAWSTLRRVPLRRLVAEPAAAGVLGTAVGIAFAPLLTPALAPATAIGAILRLRRSHPQVEVAGVLTAAGWTDLPEVRGTLHRSAPNP